MLFYTSLAIICFVVAFLGLWIFRSFGDVAKAAYTAILPSSRDSLEEPKERRVVLRGSNQNVKTPWGWNRASKPERRDPVARTNGQAVKARKSVPWGWPGSKKKAESRYSVMETVDQIRQQAEPAFQAVSDRAAKLGGDSERRASQEVGWPYRKEKSERSGNQIKAARRTRLRKTRLNKVNKPWGW
jgi:hypothetical protein